MILNREWLGRIAEFARPHDLWVFSDEAYEDFIWDGSEHCSIASLEEMWERTVSVFTFSKCFAASGMRVGYAVATPAVISHLNRSVVGAYYQAPRLGQLYAWRGMTRGLEETVTPLRREYESAWEWTRKSMECDALPSVAGFYFFVRLGEDWRALTAEETVGRMLDGGVVLAPGEYFGQDYRGWARLCFTVVPPEELREGVRRLNLLL
jgi:aspartate/methionine/tyrosine aminotransferase